MVVGKGELRKRVSSLESSETQARASVGAMESYETKSPARKWRCKEKRVRGGLCGLGP